MADDEHADRASLERYVSAWERRERALDDLERSVAEMLDDEREAWTAICEATNQAINVCMPSGRMYQVCCRQPLGLPMGLSIVEIFSSIIIDEHEPSTSGEA